MDAALDKWAECLLCFREAAGPAAKRRRSSLAALPPQELAAGAAILQRRQLRDQDWEVRRAA
eukprot:125516-Alexandrium_andersonii.AAC.1